MEWMDFDDDMEEYERGTERLTNMKTNMKTMNSMNTSPMMIMMR
ncbi:MAG: hypothetical protein V8S42_01660 [Lachnospiraceae bacterium]